MEVGRIYKIQHDRKGTFMLDVTECTETTVRGFIVEGECQMMSGGNLGNGDEVTMRLSMIKILDDHESGDPEVIDEIRRQNPGKDIPTGAELARRLRGGS